MVRAPIAMYISFIWQCKDKRKPPLCLFSKMGTRTVDALSYGVSSLLTVIASHRRSLQQTIYRLLNLDGDYALLTIQFSSNIIINPWKYHRKSLNNTLGLKWTSHHIPEYMHVIMVYNLLRNITGCLTMGLLSVPSYWDISYCCTSLLQLKPRAYNYRCLNSTKMVRAPIAMYISSSQCKEKGKPPLCLFSKMGTCILWMLQVIVIADSPKPFLLFPQSSSSLQQTIPTTKLGYQLYIAIC